jgi:hypothetical protein
MIAQRYSTDILLEVQHSMQPNVPTYKRCTVLLASLNPQHLMTCPCYVLVLFSYIITSKGHEVKNTLFYKLSIVRKKSKAAKNSGESAKEGPVLIDYPKLFHAKERCLEGNSPNS